MTRTTLAKRLNEISKQLAGLYVAYGQVSSSEIRTKSETFPHAYMETGTVTSAEKQSDAAALNFTIEKVRKLGEIKALEEERDNLRFLVKYGMEGDV